MKTAIAGEDANWGRIAMAVGKSGERYPGGSPGDLDWRRRGCSNGGPVAYYDEAPVAAHMRGGEVVIAVNAGVGDGRATVWTCDLTHGYIDINVSYRS